MPQPPRKPPARLDLRATVRVPKAAGDGGRRRFEPVAYTGEAMSLDGFDLPVVVDRFIKGLAAAPAPTVEETNAVPAAVA